LHSKKWQDHGLEDEEEQKKNQRLEKSGGHTEEVGFNLFEGLRSASNDGGEETQFPEDKTHLHKGEESRSNPTKRKSGPEYRGSPKKQAYLSVKKARKTSYQRRPKTNIANNLVCLNDSDKSSRGGVARNYWGMSG